MTGSDFIKKLTELTRAGKVKWEDESAPFYRVYAAMFTYNSGLFLRVKADEEGNVKMMRGVEIIYRETKNTELFNAISDTMPDIQQIFDNAIKELEK